MARLADQYFKSLMTKIEKEGTWDENPRPRYESDGKPASSIFLTQVMMKYDYQKNQTPITSLRPIYIRSAIEEVLWIYQDATSDLTALEARSVYWWENWKLTDGTIGQRYGATVARYDLVNRLLKGLKEDPFGRRHIMNLWQESDLAEVGALHPCAYETLWSVRRVDGDLFLDCTLIQRSSDFLVAGFINQMQYHALQLAFAKHLSYQVGTFTHFIQNVHVYDRHFLQLKEMSAREGQKEEPQFILDKPDGTPFETIQASDFKLTNYRPVHPQLKFELAV